MPRRPSKRSKQKSGPRPVDRKDGKLARWQTASDIPLDEEDQFHAARDRILLEGEGDDNESAGDDEEVFGLKGLSSSSSGEDDDEEDAQIDEDDYDDKHPSSSSQKLSKTKAATKKSKKSKTSQLSSSTSSDSEEEEEESWGRKKSAYYSNAGQEDEIDSDDDEAHELNVQEAIRLQAKARAGMTDRDFGLLDIQEIPENTTGDVAAPAQSNPAEPLPTDPKDIIRHLERNSPETLALAGDWEDTAYALMKSKAKLEALQASKPDALSLGMMHLYYQTLLTYTTMLSFYLHLRLSPTYISKPTSLRSHPIYSRLLTLKQSLSTLGELDFGILSDDEGEELDELDDGEEDETIGEGEEAEEEAGEMDVEQLWKYAKKHGLEPNELRELLAGVGVGEPSISSDDEESDGADKNDKIVIRVPAKKATNGATPKQKAKKPKGPAASSFSHNDEEVGAEQEPRPKKKRKTAVSHDAPPTPVFDLVEPSYSKKPSSSKSALTVSDHIDDVDAFGEATSLQHADAADKQARRKTLRFHTSKIENTSRRREEARAAFAGGDDDIPYKERRKEKEARERKEAIARLKKHGGGSAEGDELDDVDPEVEMGVNDDGYYDLVKQKTQERKKKNKEDYEKAVAAAKPIAEEDPTTGPRSLTRAILANKGLTPHRSKSVRNPRVKKRQRYDQAKKKVSSQKAVYKGGLSDTGGRYDGERTGISKVVKGIRLG